DLKEKFPKTPDTWDEVDCRTPEGTNEHWKKIRVVGDQSFRVPGAQKAEPKDMPGIFELWVYEGPSWVVLMAWRVPSSIEGTPPPAAVGAAARVDMTTLPALTGGTIKIDAAAAEAAAN